MKIISWLGRYFAPPIGWFVLAAVFVGFAAFDCIERGAVFAFDDIAFSALMTGFGIQSVKEAKKNDGKRN